MNIYTFADALPVRGSEAQLITAAIAAEWPKSLTQLARDAGISKFAASRAADPLTQSGLLLSTADGYSFNEDHPLAPVLLGLAWTFSGVRRPAPTFGWDTNGGDLVVDHYHFGRWLPEPLHLIDGQTDALVGPGPDLRTVRETAAWMGEFLPRLRSHEATGQEVYRRWSNERLRDLIHQTLHMGGALHPALISLRQAAGREAQGAHAPQEAHIHGLTWVQATYLASAELRGLLRVISLLNTAIRVGREIHRQRGEALFLLEQTNAIGTDSEFTDRRLQDSLAAAALAQELWEDDSYGSYRRIGGTPQVEDVGTAGDQIFAVALHRDATDLAARVKQMAEHPSVKQWATEHPEHARRTPLIREVPENLLLDLRALVQMPPPKPGAGPRQ